MATPKAVKFYVDPGLMKECERVFEEQGVKLSEGMTRLIRLLVEAPDSLRPILLGQAKGDAAMALAQHILDSAEDAADKRDATDTEPAGRVNLGADSGGSAGDRPGASARGQKA